MTKPKRALPIFEPPPFELRRVTCPACGGLTTVFCTPTYEPFAVDDDGVVHVLRCSLMGFSVHELHMKMRELETGYDSLLLAARPRFRGTLF
jgi:transcription elongation factor Elf1